MFFSFQMLLWW